MANLLRVEQFRSNSHSQLIYRLFSLEEQPIGCPVPDTEGRFLKALRLFVRSLLRLLVGSRKHILFDWPGKQRNSTIGGGY